MTIAIETEDLALSFGDLKAVDGLSFQVEQGTVFGVLGPNGAGKTTTVRLLNGLLSPTRGKSRVLGLDPTVDGSRLRAQTGVLTETPSLYERLTARENLELVGEMYGVPRRELDGRVRRALSLLGLEDRADTKAGGFSKGMKQRLAIARTLLHEPALLFLDEPTSGLDPESAQQVIELIEQLSREEGRTVFLCTHQLQEAERLCDRVALFNQGRLLAAGTVSELAERLGEGHRLEIAFFARPREGLLEGLKTLPGVLETRLADLVLSVRLADAHYGSALVSALASQGAEIRSVQAHEASLSDIYFTLQRQEREVRA
ncbi:ABC transporter ATP-binding protein [bacterium]|nr:ABC transporter ATP-binding protein [bacterium]